jgi:hypothetical protein
MKNNGRRDLRDFAMNDVGGSNEAEVIGHRSDSSRVGRSSGPAESAVGHAEDFLGRS